MSVCGSRTRPLAMSTGSPSHLVSLHCLPLPSGSLVCPSRTFDGLSGTPFIPALIPPRTSPAPLLPTISGMRRPRNSDGSPFAASQAFFSARSGFAAVETSPARVVLRPL